MKKICKKVLGAVTDTVSDISLVATVVALVTIPASALLALACDKMNNNTRNRK